MMMRWKVCGMKEEDNMARLQELAPDFMGLIFYEKSPRHAGNLDPAAVTGLPVKKIGVFVNETTGQILDYARRYELFGVQLHGNEPPDQCKVLKEAGLLVIKAFGVGNESFNFTELLPYTDYIDYFLFDTKGKYKGGNGVAFNWDILLHYPYAVPFLVSGGVDHYNLQNLEKLRHLPIAGVDVNSRYEDAPGLKNISKLCELKKELKQLTHGADSHQNR
jgi:phosphoribosylanthranilate isomerase